MDYRWHYDALIARARPRVLDCYVERHHVFPRCLGGSDEPVNLVALTPEEHFVAHLLLTKIHPDNRSLVMAAWAMTLGRAGRRSATNKRVGVLRRRMSEAVKEFQLGRPKSESQKAAMSKARLNLIYTPELREKLAANRGKKLNETQRAALLLATKGKPLSEEHRAKLKAPKGPQLQAVCPRCAKTGGVSLMKRWHFDNCKVKHHG